MGKNKTTKTDQKKPAIVVPDDSKLVTRKRKYFFNPQSGKTESGSVKTK